MRLGHCPSCSPACHLQWPPMLEGSTCLGVQIIYRCSPEGLRHTCAPGHGHTLAFLASERWPLLPSLQFGSLTPIPLLTKGGTGPSHLRFVKRRLEFLRNESWRPGGRGNTPRTAQTNPWGASISTHSHWASPCGGSQHALGPGSRPGAFRRPEVLWCKSGFGAALDLLSSAVSPSHGPGHSDLASGAAAARESSRVQHAASSRPLPGLLWSTQRSLWPQRVLTFSSVCRSPLDTHVVHLRETQS